MIHIEDIQDQVELALMRGEHHKVARAYVSTVNSVLNKDTKQQSSMSRLAPKFQQWQSPKEMATKKISL